MACTAFAGGTFEASTNCVGYDKAPMSGEAAEKTVFQWPTLTCRTALDGGPEGQTDGQVCTWNLISASTEEGRNYVDYGDCGIVHTNRPYYPLDPWQVPPTNDARLDDAEWLAESDWVQSQVRSSACVCCHSEDATPNGPSRWSVDASPLWVDTMSDEALFLFAGHTNSSVLGASDPADNNGSAEIRRSWKVSPGLCRIASAIDPAYPAVGSSNRCVLTTAASFERLPPDPTGSMASMSVLSARLTGKAADQASDGGH